RRRRRATRSVATRSCSQLFEPRAELEVAGLEQGRESYAKQAWLDAYTCLAEAGQEGRLEGPGLQALGPSAFMLGPDRPRIRVRERAHHANLEAGEPLQVARCAFWIGIQLVLAGEMGPGSGWLARAQRLVDDQGVECVERGYLLIPRMLEQQAAGNYDAAAAI